MRKASKAEQRSETQGTARPRSRLAAGLATASLLVGVLGCESKQEVPKVMTEQSANISQSAQMLARLALKDFQSDEKSWERVQYIRERRLHINKQFGEPGRPHGFVQIKSLTRDKHGEIDTSNIESISITASNYNTKGSYTGSYSYQLTKDYPDNWKATVKYPDDGLFAYNVDLPEDSPAKELNSEQFKEAADQAAFELEAHILPDKVSDIYPPQLIK